MISKVAVAVGCLVAAFAPYAAVRAQEAAKDGPQEESAEVPQANPEMTEAVKYIEALVDRGFPDFAEPLIAEAKKKWPESDAMLFAIEIRGMLSMGKFDDAEKRIASLPDRKSTKFWAARLEVANNYFARNRKADGINIYEEFFKLFPTAPKDIVEFYNNACYAYGQLLYADKQYAKAAARYEELLKSLNKNSDVWLNLASETAKMYLKLADESSGKDREGWLKRADKVISKLLWRNDAPVYFGMAVSMKAHVAELRGNAKRAEELIEEFMDQLSDIHDQLVAADPDGKLGFVKLSPLPECLYLQAKLLWKAAQEEYKKPKRDDEQVKSLMFGAKDKNSGKRDGHGAYNMSVNVFFQYSSSPWAAPAGELSEEIREFAEKSYNAKIKTNITKEQIAQMRVQQFKAANDFFLADQYKEAVSAYYEVLSKYPELPESADAVGRIISCLLDLVVEEQNETLKAEYRMDADAIESYVTERFAGATDRLVMISGGNAAISAAAKEQERKELGRADALYTKFFLNYTDHPNAAPLCQGRAMTFQKEEKYLDAIKYWEILENHYTNTVQYVPAIAQLAYCWGLLGDTRKQVAYLNKYLPIEKVAVNRLTAQMMLAQMYQKQGLEILNNAGTNTTEEAVTAAEKAGSAQIIRAIKQFTDFSKQTAEAIADPATTKVDKEKYAYLREAAMFLVGDCYRRINRPEKALEAMRKRAVESYQAYVEAYPEGKFVKSSYVQLGTMYTAMGDVEKSKEALDALSRKFPDSDEAKNAMPRLANNLIEMGKRREGTDIYAQMLRTDGKYTANQFLDAGEALINARSWDLANQAFEKAARMASTNQATVVAKARLGQAKSAFRQGSLAEAREALDLFLADKKMSKMQIAPEAHFLLVEVASAQGKTEKDADMRKKYFGAAIGSLGKVRGYWKKSKPQWEQDKLDLLSGDVMIRRMEAEEAMGLKEEALETCGSAASKFQVFIQAHSPTEAVPIDKMDVGSQNNLEEAYSKLLPLLVKKGKEQADKVVELGEEYLRMFPNGKAKMSIINCMNQAKADLPADGGAPKSAEAAPAEAAPAEEKSAEAAPAEEKPAEAAPAEAEEKPAEESKGE